MPEGVSIRIEDLVKSYSEKVTPVDHVTLTADRGEFLTLLGPSGCGKTTTLRCIAGLETPTAGKIYFGDELINDVLPNKRGVGFVFQNWALFPHLTVSKNIAFGLELQKAPKSTIKERITESLELVRLSGLEDRYPRQLSGGQQQRVAVARAISFRPRVLLFDEPLSNLDAKLRKEMRIELRELQKELGITSIYVTHDQTEAFAMSDRVALFYKGKIQQLGTPIDIFIHPSNFFVADFIGFQNFLKAKVTEIDTKARTMKFVTSDGECKLTSENIYDIENFSKNEVVMLGARAGEIKFHKSGERPINAIDGTVRALLYHGDVTNYYIKPERSEYELTVTRRAPPELKKGDAITISLPPASLAVLKTPEVAPDG